MTARPVNIWGRISEQKSEKSCISGFQAFDYSEGEFSFLKRLLLNWKNESGRTEIELLKPPLIRPSASFSPKEKAKTKGLLHAKTIKFANEINALKTLAQLGEGGPS